MKIYLLTGYVDNAIGVYGVTTSIDIARKWDNLNDLYPNEYYKSHELTLNDNIVLDNDTRGLSVSEFEKFSKAANIINEINILLKKEREIWKKQ